MSSILLLLEKKEKALSHKKRIRISKMPQLLSKEKGNINDIADCIVFAIKTSYITLKDFENIYKKVKARIQ